MTLKKRLSVLGISFLGSTFAVLTEPNPSSACTGWLGSLDPTCPGRPFYRPKGGSSDACLQVLTDAKYKFKIANSTSNNILYQVNGRQYKLSPNYTISHEFPKALGSDSCNVTRYPLPKIEFDFSFDQGYQARSYSVGERDSYYFNIKNNEIDLFSGTPRLGEKQASNRDLDAIIELSYVEVLLRKPRPDELNYWRQRISQTRETYDDIVRAHREWKARGGT